MNQGRDWTAVKPLLNHKVVSILVSEADPNTLFIGTEKTKYNGGGMFVSHDGGKTAKKVSF